MRSFRIFGVFAVLLLSLVLTVSAEGTPVSLEVVSDSVSDYFDGMCFDPSTLSLSVDYGSGTVGLSSSSCGVRLFGKYSGGGLVSIVDLPYQSSSLVYDGTAKVPVFADFDADELTVSGVVGAVNAGTYTALFKPKPGYQWSDGSTIAKSVGWSIEKAVGSMSLSATNVEVNKGETASFTVTRVGDGAISAVSSDTSVATVSVSGNTVTLTGVSNGNATITVSVAEGTNHAAPTSKTVATTVVTPMPAVGTTLESCTWEQIRAISDAGKGDEYFNVGDTKSFTLNGKIGATFFNQTMYATILGFDHNSDQEGENTIHFMISAASDKMVGLVDSYYGYHNGGTGAFKMNASSITNVGGWSSSHMRSTVLGSNSSPSSPTANTMLAALPADLRAVLQPATKYSDNTGNFSNNSAAAVTATTDYLFLLSEYEVLGARKCANSNEQNYQEQYAYFQNHSKIAYKHNDTGTAAYWWLRSAYYTGNTYFCYTHTDGSTIYISANYSEALVAGFVI